MLTTNSSGVVGKPHTNTYHLTCEKCKKPMVMRPANPCALIPAHEHFCNTQGCPACPYTRTPVNTSFARSLLPWMS